jgi:penicillin amidase
VPVRDDQCRRVPVPAWDPAYEWRGYATMPRRSVTTVVNANDRRDCDTAELGVDFAAPHRAGRIAALLAGGAPPASVHMDTALPFVSPLLAQLEPGTDDGLLLRDRLVAWDGRMDADSVDAGAFAAWRTVLVRRLTEHPDLAPLLAPSEFDPLFAPWTDPVSRIGRAWHPLAARFPDVAAAALDEAASHPAETWGSRHVLAPIHLIPATALTATVELSGDNNCVLATSSIPGVSDACWRGPVCRYIWDLSDRSRSRWIVPFGASGRPGDPHFADQLPLWAAGDLIPLITDWAELKRED